MVNVFLAGFHYGQIWAIVPSPATDGPVMVSD